MQTPTTLQALRQAFLDGERPKLLFFWGHARKHGRDLGKECLSQWYPATFVVNGHVFPTAEHFMMFKKALLFQDEACAAEVLRAPSPGAAKALGRRVRGFDETVWEAHRAEIVLEASLEKFRQTAALRDFLVSTGNQVLVEASPTDTVWGIGLSGDDPRAKDPSEWCGLNLLGFTLMAARDRLR